jgi:3-oxoacyl-[acyl-carrier protein] reductase
VSELDGYVALVTGGSRGSNVRCAWTWAAAGANMAFTYRIDEGGACETIGAIEATGRCGIALRADGAASGSNRAGRP